jgi:putative ABC transport system substrate-binding protein
MKKIPVIIFMLLLIAGCSVKPDSKVPVVGFLDFVTDPTIAQAKQGFLDALKVQGFSEADTTMVLIYSNAQGDIPTLGQSCDLLVSKNCNLIATNVTLSTITAVKRTSSIPLFMMVSPRPDLAGLNDRNNHPPKNLFGVYETLDYIDTAVSIITQLAPSVKKIGTIYNHSEPQSEAAFNVLQKKCNELGLSLENLPVNNSFETQLVTQALLNKDIDAFFALPDNVIFASFETIAKSCNDKHVPIFTSESGLVKRGALASFGADFYEWGFQSGSQAAQYLLTKSLDGLQPEIVMVRRKVYNPEVARMYGIMPDSTFEAVK